jgi:hypothetical protein
MKKKELRPAAAWLSSAWRRSSKARETNQLLTRPVAGSMTPGSQKRATQRLPPMSPKVAVSKKASPAPSGLSADPTSTRPMVAGTGKRLALVP